MTGTKGTPRAGVPPSVSSILGRLIALAVIDAVALVFGYALANGGLLLGAVVLAIITVLVNIVFLVDRLYPLRWVAPGVMLTVLMVVYPLLFTVYIALTNYGQGHILSKAQVIERLESQYFTPEEGGRLSWLAYRSPANNFLFVLENEQGERFLGDPNTGIADFDPSDPRFGELDPTDGLPATIDNYLRLNRIQVVQFLTRLQDVRIQGEVQGEPADIRIVSLDRADLGQQLYSYDPARDVIVNNQTDTDYVSREGFFVGPDGTQLRPGFQDLVGLHNFVRAFTDPQIRGPFLGVFVWTFAFAGLSVLTTFFFGLALALIFNDQRLPAKGIFRTLAIVPYTIPGFISALIWVGLLNPLFGPVNLFIRDLIGISPQWFSDGNLAKVAILLINLWLGYPYMMLVTLGALQSIPSDLYEAAQIDGANAWQQFRKITFPLLLVAIAPLLIGSFAFNFNNFTLIDLVTQGGPPTPGATTPAGQTDILISYTYRVAFASGQGNDYAFAAAISMFIFVIIAAITIFNFRLSRRLEDLV